LRWEDRLRSHPAYVHSALSASRVRRFRDQRYHSFKIFAQIFVAVHDDPSIATTGTTTGDIDDFLDIICLTVSSSTNGCSEKGQEKGQKSGSEGPRGREERFAFNYNFPRAQADILRGLAPAQQSQNDDKGLEPTTKDEDLDGSKLLGCTDPLERAAKVLKPLATLTPNNIEVWIATYDVAVRRSESSFLRYLLSRSADDEALQRSTSKHPRRWNVPPHSTRNTPNCMYGASTSVEKVLWTFLGSASCWFSDTSTLSVSSLPNPAPAAVAPILAEALAQLLPNEVSFEVFNSQYLQRHSTSAPAVLAVAKVLLALQAPRDQVEDTVFTVLRAEVSLDIKVS
jgi:peptide alpha-N-acetyltransferase